MAAVEAEVVVNAPVSRVAENLEAFLWADDARTDDPNHEPCTTAVRKVNARQFVEEEVIDLIVVQETATTNYTLKAEPGRKTRITMSAQIPPLVGAMAQAMGADLQAEMAQGAQRWAARFDAYLAKQVQRGTEGVGQG